MVDLKPTGQMREEAEQGLRYRREYGRGGTAVGIARARDISNGKDLSPSTVRRMKAFFDRHEQNRVPPSRKKMPDGGPTNGWIAWLLWGGDSGRAWAERKVKELEEREMNSSTMHVGVSRGAGMPENRFRAVISNGTVDRYGTSFDPHGADVRNYLKNPVVYLKHDRSMLPIGHANSLTLTAGGNWEAEFEIDGVTELERVVIAKLNSGTLNAVSIGAQVNPARAEKGKDGVLVFREWELMEFSVVDIPGNPEALITARDWQEVIAEHKQLKGIKEEVVEERIGKKLSRKNEELLKTALAAINQILSEIGDDESEVEEGEEEETERPYDEEDEEEERCVPSDYVEALMWELDERDLQALRTFEEILEEL